MLAPWNEVCAVKFLKWGKFSFLSEKGIFQGYQAIPLGIYTFSRGFSKAASGHIEGGAFLLLTFGVEPLSLKKVANKDLTRLQEPNGGLTLLQNVPVRKNLQKNQTNTDIAFLFPRISYNSPELDSYRTRVDLPVIKSRRQIQVRARTDAKGK